MASQHPASLSSPAIIPAAWASAHYQSTQPVRVVAAPQPNAAGLLSYHHPQPQLNTPLVEAAAAANNNAADPQQELGFPARLHYMLSDIHKEGIFTHIVSWQPHGRCFVVHDKKQFVAKILCLWFRQSKWASFQRQLNMYGFQRLSQGPDKGGYYHEMFLQDQPQLASRIHRQKLKGNGPRRPAQPEAEPNFYGMAPATFAPSTAAALLASCVKPQPPVARAPAGAITLKNSLILTASSVSPQLQPSATGSSTAANRVLAPRPAPGMATAATTDSSGRKLLLLAPAPGPLQPTAGTPTGSRVLVQTSNQLAKMTPQAATTTVAAANHNNENIRKLQILAESVPSTATSPVVLPLASRLRGFSQDEEDTLDVLARWF